MKLKKSDFKGTSVVYRFTLKQLVFNKANIISAVVTMLILFMLIPGMSMLNGRGDGFFSEDSAAFPTTVYVNNETGYEIDLSYLEENYNTEVKYSDSDVIPNDNEAYVRIYFNPDGGSYVVDVTGGSDWSGIIASEVSDALYSARGAGAVTSGWSVGTYSMEDYTSDEEFSMGSYYLQLIYTIIVMIVSMYSAAYIVQSVVQEKTSKLVETLMISVKPLALLLGKIFAVMTFVFGLLLANIAAALLGNFVSAKFFGGQGFTAMLAGLDISLADLRLDALALVSAIVSLLLGYMTYSLIAGMSGAGCSEQEDIQSANSTSVMIIMICYAGALIFSNFTSEAVRVTISLIPMLSIFCAPVQYMLGGISFPVLLLSWVIQLAVIVLLAVMCAKIYEDLIIYRGKKISFGEMIKMAKNKKGEGEA